MEESEDGGAAGDDRFIFESIKGESRFSVILASSSLDDGDTSMSALTTLNVNRFLLAKAKLLVLSSSSEEVLPSS